MKKIAAAFISLSLVAGGIHPVLAAVQSSDVTTFYVASDGNDNGDGSVSSPFATPEKARDTIREMKKDNTLGSGGAVVYFRGGTYSRLESFTLTEEDSGSDGAPITYRAYPGEQVSLVGGVNVSPEKFQHITDERMIRKIGDNKIADKILQVNLTDLGVKKIPDVWLVGAYSYSMPYFNKFCGWPEKAESMSSEVFVNGQALTLARYPNDTKLKVEKVVDAGMYGWWWYDYEDMTDRPEFVPPEKRKVEDIKPFTIVPSDMSHIAKWETADDAIIYSQVGALWGEASIPLKSVDTQKGTITSLWPAPWGVYEGGLFYIYNLIEELDTPGEYYLDRNTNMMYFYPPENGRESELDVSLSLLTTPIFDLDGASYINIKNFDLKETVGKGVEVTGGSHNLIENCEISLTADKAVNIDGGTYNGIKSCRIHDNNGGIFVSGGDSETLTPAYNYVENCDIHDYARFTKAMVVGLQLNGVGNRASYNKIYNGEQAGMGYGGQYLTVEYNEFTNLGTQGNDMAAFYVGRYMLSRGNQIKYNYVHDINSDAGGVHGMYFDDGQSGDNIIGNVFKSIDGWGIHMTGRDTTVLNNIFIDCGNAVNMDYRVNGYKEGYISNKFAVASLDVPYINSDLWLERFPELKDAQKDVEVQFHKNNKINQNLIYKSGPIVLHGDLPVTWGENKNNWTTTADPGFYDEKSGNYLLKSDSKVYQNIEGFKPIPFTRIGMYSSRAYNRIKNAVGLYVNSPFAFVSGEKKNVDTSGKAAPFISDDTTFVPLRFAAEALGGEANYENGKITITIDGKTLELNQGSAAASVNGTAVDLEKPVLTKDDLTYVPLRKVSELFDKQVFWDDCGFISISDTENLFDSTLDRQLINYLSSEMNIY